LLGFGTEAQQRRFLPGILSADEIWVQGYSEPGAGSDLAALQTRAERVGDHYVVNGQKVWTTNGLHGDWIFCLVRTDPDVRKQAGIGFLLIDARSPGIDIRPLVTVTGDRDFCEVFFRDVEVPAENMVGEPTQGWQIANHVLMHERGADLSVLRYGRFLDEIAERARETRHGGRPLVEDPVFRERWAALRTEFEALRLRVLDSLELARRGEEPGAGASAFKLQSSEYEQRLMALATDVQGPYAQLWQDGPHSVDDGIWQWREFWSRAGTIFGGSSQIQRNIIAQRVLGLPRI
ncbi:MAG: acyl-CoA dehydrogenase family protein, partial [Proteobacteria bacterium]|nr:acyl-CoA dehydrogenase family protein [Pseudomonadota bacterium]